MKRADRLTQRVTSSIRSRAGSLLGHASTRMLMRSPLSPELSDLSENPWQTHVKHGKLWKVGGGG